MPLVSTKEMLKKARREGYAVGAFNFFNLESAKAIIAAAEAEQAPVILQVWSGFEKFIGIDVLGAIGICEAKKAKVPVAVHLDHGESLGDIGKSIIAGLTSVMFDGSALIFNENVAITKNVVDFCKGTGISVEGEIGHVGGSEDGNQDDAIIYTDPEEARRFYELTGVDSLAVSIGTMHGKYQNKPTLDLKRLEAIATEVPIPLVLHGSSYTPEFMLAESVKYGIAKINVATELNDMVIKSMINYSCEFKNAKYSNEITDKAYEDVTLLVRYKIRLFGGNGRIV